jgi:hypothetical protein
VVELHAQAAHHRQTAQVRRIGDGDHPREVQRSERMVQPAGRSLGGIAMAVPTVPW